MFCTWMGEGGAGQASWKKADCDRKGWQPCDCMLQWLDNFSYMQINHSQKLSERPLVPWVIAMNYGRVLAAHCNCMAGMGETCSHDASLLWAIGVGIETRESLTVTQRSAYWVLPLAVTSIPCAPIKENDFIGKKGKERGSESDGSIRSSSSCPSLSKKQICTPIESEEKQLFTSLASCAGAKPAVLAVVPMHTDAYVSTSLAPELPMMLSDLYRTEVTLSYQGLVQIASSTEVAVTSAVEAKTRKQANSWPWFKMWTGQIMASRFKPACCTDPANPSVSLIMTLCNPEAFRFCNTTTSWGCQHEKAALEKYKSQSLHLHKNFKVAPCGFFISTEYPFLGGSPDSVVECSCCGQAEEVGHGHVITRTLCNSLAMGKLQTLFNLLSLIAATNERYMYQSRGLVELHTEKLPAPFNTLPS